MRWSVMRESSVSVSEPPRLQSVNTCFVHVERQSVPASPVKLIVLGIRHGFSSGCKLSHVRVGGEAGGLLGRR